MVSERFFNKIDSIKISGLTKKYGANFAVDNLNLDIKGGELLILIGGSGSGKTTTLKMINKMIKPDLGKIEINGIDTADLDEVRLRRNIGYVIQQIGLFPHLTVGQNIGLLPGIEGWDRKKIDRKVNDLLRLVDLDPGLFANRYPKELSGGQQQRTGLARSLVMDPPLLLMDEPFGALDPILRRQLQEEFIEIKKDIGNTIIFVTHDINEAFKLGDRIAIMQDAGLIQLGSPEEILFDPKNEIVSNLVEADKKFRYIECLKVKDLLSPLSPRHIFSSSEKSKNALKVMNENDINIAVVAVNNHHIGIVKRRDLYDPNKKNCILKERIKEIPVFSPDDSALSALRKLKDLQSSSGLIKDDKKIKGIFIPDEVVMKLL